MLAASTLASLVFVASHIGSPIMWPFILQAKHLPSAISFLRSSKVIATLNIANFLVPLSGFLIGLLGCCGLVASTIFPRWTRSFKIT